MTTLSWGITPLHPGRAHTVLEGTDVSTCTRHLRAGQLILEQITGNRPSYLRVCPECAIATLELLYPAPPSPQPPSEPHDDADPRLRRAS